MAPGHDASGLRRLGGPPGQGDYWGNPKLLGPEGDRVVEGLDIVTDLALEWLDGREDADAPFL